MKVLTENDILDLQVKAVGKESVTLPAEDFEALVAGYTPYVHIAATGKLRRKDLVCDECGAGCEE